MHQFNQRDLTVQGQQQQRLTGQEPKPLQGEHRNRIINELETLANLRMATVQNFSSLADALLGYDLDEIKQACTVIADRPRQPGETAFPDSGTIKAAIKQVRAQRYNADRAAVRETQSAGRIWDMLSCNSCSTMQCAKAGSNRVKCCNCGSPYLVAA